MEGTNRHDCLSHLWSPLQFKSHIHSISQLEGSLKMSILCRRSGNWGPDSFSQNVTWSDISSVTDSGLPDIRHSVLGRAAASMERHLKRKTFMYILDYTGMPAKRGRWILLACSQTCISPISKQTQNSSIALSLQNFAAECLTCVVCTQCVPFSSSHLPNLSLLWLPFTCELLLQGHDDFCLGKPNGPFWLHLAGPTVRIDPVDPSSLLNHFLPLTSRTPRSPGFPSVTFAFPTATSLSSSMQSPHT